MPESVKEELATNPKDAWMYAVAWGNTFDYAYGFDDMRELNQAKSSFGSSLLENANRELQTAVSQLLESHPNSKAAMSCRMATEMFLKAFLVLKASFSEDDVRCMFGHYLHKSLAKVRELYPNHELLFIESRISVFPKIKDRYTGEELSSKTLWEIYRITLHVASFVIRSFTDRNTLKQLLEQSEVS